MKCSYLSCRSCLCSRLSTKSYICFNSKLSRPETNCSARNARPVRRCTSVNVRGVCTPHLLMCNPIASCVNHSFFKLFIKISDGGRMVVEGRWTDVLGGVPNRTPTPVRTSPLLDPSLSNRAFLTTWLFPNPHHNAVFTPHSPQQHLLY